MTFYMLEVPVVKLAVGMIAVMAGSGLAARGALALADSTIGDSTPVTIGVVAIGIGGVWYLATTLQRLRDDSRSTSRRLSRIERKMGISESEDADDRDDD